MSINTPNLRNYNYNVSWFDNIKHVHCREIDIVKEFLIPIKEQNFKKQIDQIRKFPEKKDRNKLKMELLPGITTSGIFDQTHQAKDIKVHSGMIQIDVDAADNNTDHLTSFIRDIKTDNYVFAGFVSPSGDGYKLIVRIPAIAAEHQSCFSSLKLYFIEKYHIRLDDKCKDVSRFMYISSDPACFINMESEIYQPQNHTFQKLISWANNNYSFTKGSRNEYITQLAGACNRYGLHKADILPKLIADYVQPDFTVKEIESTVESIYRNENWFNTSKFDLSEQPKPKTNGNTVPAVSPFPVDVFPKFIQSLIFEANKVYSFHNDFIAGSILMATSMGIGNTHNIRTNYINNSVLYLAIVQRKGTGKSHPIDFALQPFLNIDRTKLNEYKVEKRKFEMLLRSKDLDNTVELQIN